MPNMVTIKEAADALGCTRENVYQLIKRHGLETETKPITVRRTITRQIQSKHVDLDVLDKISNKGK